MRNNKMTVQVNQYNPPTQRVHKGDQGWGCIVPTLLVMAAIVAAVLLFVH
jgi:hypothetical protein